MSTRSDTAHSYRGRWLRFHIYTHARTHVRAKIRIMASLVLASGISTPDSDEHWKFEIPRNDRWNLQHTSNNQSYHCNSV